jgi:hypothetical protein
MENFCIGEFCVHMTIRDRRTNFRWVMIIVYGPVNHELSRDFLEEIGDVHNQSVLPVLIGGDFNLIREVSDKNSNNIDFQMMDLFNSFIGEHHLRELKRSGQKERPIMVNLDRVFFFMGWEERYPLSIS